MEPTYSEVKVFNVLYIKSEPQTDCHVSVVESIGDLKEEEDCLQQSFPSMNIVRSYADIKEEGLELFCEDAIKTHSFEEDRGILCCTESEERTTSRWSTAQDQKSLAPRSNRTASANETKSGNFCVNEGHLPRDTTYMYTHEEQNHDGGHMMTSSDHGHPQPCYANGRQDKNKSPVFEQDSSLRAHEEMSSALHQNGTINQSHDDSDPSMQGSAPSGFADEIPQTCVKTSASHKETYNHIQHTFLECSESNQCCISEEELAEQKNQVQELYSCSYAGCGKSFPTSPTLSGHMKSHCDPGERPFECITCKKRFSSKRVLKKHGQTHTRHMKTHSNKNEMIYKCSICKRTYSAELVNKREGEKPYRCSCKKGFLEEAAVTLCRRLKKYCCTICHIKFCTTRELAKHLETTHPGENTTFSCPECDKTFLLETQVKNHIKDVHRNEPKICPLCGAVLGCKRSLERHLDMHRGERNYKCLMCEKTYRDERSLKYHIAAHIGIKSHKCTWCEKSFIDKYSLKSHIKTHTGEKHQLCSLCGNMFRNNRDLQSHLRLHAGEKPFQCIECSKSYSSASSLRLHLRTHVGGKQFQCPKCNERFYTKSVLSIHLKKHNADC